MSLYTGKQDIIHTAAAANLTAYTYSQVYAQATATPTINGVAITMPAGTTIDIIVKSISATADVFVFGHKSQVFTANPNLGGLNT